MIETRNLFRCWTVSAAGRPSYKHVSLTIAPWMRYVQQSDGCVTIESPEKTCYDPWARGCFGSAEWTSGAVPRNWSEAVLLPLFKKEDKRIFSNRKGISLIDIGFRLCAPQKIPVREELANLAKLKRL